MARNDFIEQLRALGYKIETVEGARITLDYLIPLGKFLGEQIKLGFEVSDDFPLSTPSGPHINRHFHALKPGGEHPTGGIHPSPFGSEWQYWSRPFHEWNKTNHTVAEYMAFIRWLFEKQ